MNKHLYALLFGMAIASGGQDALAQVVRGSNGSQSALAPLSLNKKSARRMSSANMKFRADFVQSRNQYFVLGFQQVLSPEVERLVTRHARILTYVPDNMYILTTTTAPETAVAAIKSDLQGKATIVAEGALPAHYKLAPRIYDCVKEVRALSEEMSREGIVVATLAPEDREALEKTLDKWHVVYELTKYEQVRLVEPTTQLVAQVAALPYVSFLTVYEEPKELAFNTAHIAQSNRIFGLNYDRKGPIGRGVTFANWESYGGEYEHDINTYGRNVKGFTDNSINEHGTHCGLIASGADNIEENWNRGMAPGVQVIAMNNSLAPWGVHHNGVKTALSKGYKPLVSNHSVGWNVAELDIYNDATATIDRLIYDSNAYMCCYSAGNSAEGKTKYPPYKEYDYGRLTGHIKTNKNGFTVHSVIYPGVDVTWANFGPTFDGRMKPELCAEGSGGTSYASPGMAGITSVLLEQCKESLGYHRIDVVKAVMLNTALDVRTYANKGKEEGFGIDYRTGYGEVHPIAAAKSLKEKRVHTDSIAHGGESRYTIDVPAGQTELNVTLYWNDPAAANGANKALVNDLDLVVIGPDGKEVLPWTLDPSPDNVSKPAKRTENRRDNHERVRIVADKAQDTLPAGQYTIRVKGHYVPRGPQAFATTWQWKQRGIEWTSIPEGFRVSAGDRLLLTWDMTLADEEERKAPNFSDGEMTPVVYYRTTPVVEGKELDPTEAGWKKCMPASGARYWENTMTGKSNVVGGTLFGKNFFQWEVPSNLGNTSDLRFLVVAGKKEGEILKALSPKAQLGEQLHTRPTILSLSDEKVKLSWKPATRVKKGKYQIYALFDKYMTQVGEVPIGTTTAEITAPDSVKWNADQFFAVGVYDEDSQTQGKRSLPSGLDPYNTEAVDRDEIWQPFYKLCPGEVVAFSANRLEGDIQWFKNGKPIEGEQGKKRQIPLSMEDAGRYSYTVTLNGNQVFKSPEFKIQSGGIKRSDADLWGEYSWAGTVYGKNAEDTSLPATAKLPFHGKFKLDKFSFNSHTDLFESDKGKASDIVGYAGCDSERGSKALFVMRRRGFNEGVYTLQFHRASGRAKVIIVDAHGRRREYTTSPNSFDSKIGEFKLDEKSTIELQWTGVHCAFSATYKAPAADLAVRPGQVKASSLSLWIDPTTQPEADGKAVKRIFDAYPQAETYTLTGSVGARLIKNGSNFNAGLRFDGYSSYAGGMRSPNVGTTATDFVVLSSQRNKGNDRVLAYGNGTSENGMMDSYAIYINGSNQLATVRNGNKAEQLGSNGSRTMLYTIARDEKDVTIAANGAKITARTNGFRDALNLQKMTIGGSFDLATPNYFRGVLGEVVHYDGALTENDTKRIRTYLAIKHGITLDHDYLDVNNVPLFETSYTAKYRYQIMGIGREDNSRLNQKQTQGQMLNGNATQLILSLGDLANSNSENKNSFANNSSYYILGATDNYPPSLMDGTVSRVNYHLRTTLPKDAKADVLSFILPRAGFVKDNKRAFIEFSNKEFTSKNIDESNQLVELKNYPVGNKIYLRAQYAPAQQDTYFRVVWKEGGVTSLTTLTNASESVNYDPTTRTAMIDVQGVSHVDLTDLSGRIVATNIPVVNGKAHLPQLAPATYMLTLRNANTAISTVKLVVTK